ncbi:MAG TPA: hypothetical protein ENN52_07495 [Methanofollis liminatans]|uniref:Uncharacterized protein n=1 Tax=Methanofollis liminatans TaxID=2201 RepID=A0A831PM46_9EURY|nr:hypothetical protein [Methanofollis liminatans]
MNATLRLGSDDALYLLIGERRYRIAAEDLRALLFYGRAVPVTGEGTAIAGHAAVNAAGRAVRVFTVRGHFIVPLVSFRRVAAGEAASAPLFPLVPEGGA